MHGVDADSNGRPVQREPFICKPMARKQRSNNPTGQGQERTS
jgi:hypothetical protein